MSGQVLELTDSTFENEVLKADIPVIVDFWAPWCGPCKMLAPTIEEIAEEYSGKVRIAKVNTDLHQKHAAAYQVTGLPTLLMFKGGQIVEKFVGLAPKGRITSAINKHIG